VNADKLKSTGFAQALSPHSLPAGSMYQGASSYHTAANRHGDDSSAMEYQTALQSMTPYEAMSLKERTNSDGKEVNTRLTESSKSKDIKEGRLSLPGALTEIRENSEAASAQDDRRSKSLHGPSPLKIIEGVEKEYSSKEIAVY